MDTTTSLSSQNAKFWSLCVATSKFRASCVGEKLCYSASTGLKNDQSNQLTNQAQREKRFLFGDFAVRECSKKIAQKIAKKWKNYEESVVRKRIEPGSWKLMNSLLHQKQNLSTVNQLLAQIQDLQDKVTSVNDARDFFKILKQWAALERSTFPVNYWPFRVPEERPAAILDCRMIHGMFSVLQETFDESLLVREGPPTFLFENSRNLASSSRGLRPDGTGNTTVPKREMRREPQHSSLPLPPFEKRAGILHHTGWTYSHNGMIDYPRFQISELHLGKFPESLEFESWKVKF